MPDNLRPSFFGGRFKKDENPSASGVQGQCCRLAVNGPRGRQIFCPPHPYRPRNFGDAGTDSPQTRASRSEKQKNKSAGTIFKEGYLLHWLLSLILAAIDSNSCSPSSSIPLQIEFADENQVICRFANLPRFLLFHQVNRLGKAGRSPPQMFDHLAG